MSSDKPALRSFGRRRGRKPKATRQALLDELLPTLEVGSWRDHPPQPLWLEIGFGSGEHVLAQARAHPNVHIIGCEPYVDGVGVLLMSLAENPPANLRIHADDVRLLLPHIPPGGIDRVFILFPDPWPKSRHHKRRLIQPAFLDELARLMKPGAELRLATDHEDYLTWMLEHLLASPHFRWTATAAADWEQPPADWVRTKYQEWAEAEGRRSTYLHFVRL